MFSGTNLLCVKYWMINEMNGKFDISSSFVEQALFKCAHIKQLVFLIVFNDVTSASGEHLNIKPFQQ